MSSSSEDALLIPKENGKTALSWQKGKSKFNNILLQPSLQKSILSFEADELQLQKTTQDATSVS